MKLRHKILLTLLAGHLVLVVCGAASIVIPGDNPVSKTVRKYGEISGVENDYAYFAPTAGTQHRFHFVMTDKDGQQWTDGMRFGKTQESNLRLTSLANYVSGSHPDHQFFVMKSLAGKMFARHPQAETVTVKYQLWAVMQPTYHPDEKPYPNFPRMNQVRAGAKPRWIKFDELTFTRVGSSNEAEQHSKVAAETKPEETGTTASSDNS